MATMISLAQRGCSPAAPAYGASKGPSWSAAALGLTFPPSFYLRADEVIE
jgi:hypothetical protein